MRNTREIVKSANLIGFLDRLAVFAYFGQKPISLPLKRIKITCHKQSRMLSIHV